MVRVVGVGSRSLQNETDRPQYAGQLTNEWRRKLPGMPDSLLTTGAYLIQAVQDN